MSSYLKLLLIALLCVLISRLPSVMSKRTLLLFVNFIEANSRQAGVYALYSATYRRASCT